MGRTPCRRKSEVGDIRPHSRQCHRTDARMFARGSQFAPDRFLSRHTWRTCTSESARGPSAHTIPGIQVRFGDGRHDFGRSAPGDPSPCREHGSASRCCRCKREKTGCLDHVDVNGLHAAAHEVCLVPEPRSARVAHEAAPPFTMRCGTRPSLQRVEIAPVLAHPGMRREQRK